MTDSSVQFLYPSSVQHLEITIVPMTIRFGRERLVDGLDLDADMFFHRVLTDGMPRPELIAPTVADYAAVFSQAAPLADGILVLPMARGMSESFRHAQLAAQALMGRCEIAVIDSMTTSVGLGFLVEEAARAAHEHDSLEQVVRIVRGAVPRVYSVFYVETLDYIFHANLIGEAQAILGKMLGIKPFLTIEDGELVTMEKARTRNQAIDKLLEFVSEFSHLDKMVILQNTPHLTEQARLLQDRLALEFNGRDFPIMMYGPALGTHLGPDGVGLVIFEGEAEDDEL
ncbi:MAG: DegV family protein [Anaerolineae bacterium]|nr:DegV family protein [Anaerolineae bacterium]